MWISSSCFLYSFIYLYLFGNISKQFLEYLLSFFFILGAQYHGCTKVFYSFRMVIKSQARVSVRNAALILCPDDICPPGWHPMNFYRAIHLKKDNVVILSVIHFFPCLLQSLLPTILILYVVSGQHQTEKSEVSQLSLWSMNKGGPIELLSHLEGASSTYMTVFSC